MKMEFFQWRIIYLSFFFLFIYIIFYITLNHSNNSIKQLYHVRTRVIAKVPNNISYTDEEDNRPGKKNFYIVMLKFILIFLLHLFNF